MSSPPVCGMDFRLTRDSEAGGDDLCSWCVDSSRIRVLGVSNPQSGCCRSMKKCGGSSKLEARYHRANFSPEALVTALVLIEIGQNFEDC